VDDVVYRAEISVRREAGPDRTAQMPGGEQVAFGVHGAIAEHYGVDMEGRDATSTTLDYVMAAAGG
jgi:hypothetical protein